MRLPVMVLASVLGTGKTTRFVRRVAVDLTGRANGGL
jgi:hypothetical protein